MKFDGQGNATPDIYDHFTKARKEADALRAENERLRDALRWLLSKANDISWVHMKSEPCNCKTCAKNNAVNILRE